MPLDDRPRDREAEAAVAAERLARRALAVKAAENRIALRRLDAGAVVVDLHMHLVAQPGRRHADEAARRRETDRIVDDIVDRAFEPVAVAHHDGRPLARAREGDARVRGRSEEHTSELQSLMRISYAVFCLKKKIQ